MEYLKEDEQTFSVLLEGEFQSAGTLRDCAKMLLSRLIEARKRVEELERENIIPTEGKQPGQWSAEDYRRDADVQGVAERIIRRVVTNVMSTAYSRASLDDVEYIDPIDEKEFVEDALSVALGEGDMGCLDTDDLSDENCEVLFVAKELRELLKRAPSVSPDCKVHGMSKEGKNEG